MATHGSDDDQESDGDLEVGSGNVSTLGGDEQFKKSCKREIALITLMEKTGYNILQVNGQRMYGGPPPGWDGPPPPRGCEVFVGKIPRDMYEDELVPLFETAGKLYEFRLMMEFNGNNRGYAFIMFTNRDEAQKAIRMFNNYQVRPERFIGVCLSLNNCRLFIGCIPKDKSKDDVMEKMNTVTEGVVDVIMYPSTAEKGMNRGFAFVEYETHKVAALARRMLIAGNRKLWGDRIQVDWAKPEKDIDETTMQHVRILYVRNLMLSTTEETLYQEFSRFKPGCVERVKKLSDYAFIHYYGRDDAITALGLLNGAQVDGASLEVMLARPSATREQSVAVLRCNSRGYLGNRKRGDAGAGNGTFLLDRSNSGMGDMDKCPPMGPVPLTTHPGSPMCSGARENPERTVFPLLPGTALSPTSLQVINPSQISSAVSLLDFYCYKKHWSKPQYHLFSTPGQDGKLLLLCKVVITSTQSNYVPDQLCMLLDDAKELAAQTALWNLDSSLLNEASYNSPRSLSPPIPISLPPTNPGLLTCDGRVFAHCLPPPPPPPSPSPFNLPPLSPLSILTLPDSQTQGGYMNSQSSYY